MDLDGLRRAIFDSSPSDWHVIVCGGGEGPSYLDAFGAVTRYEGGTPHHWLEHDCQSNRGTYRPDVSVGIAWGLSFPADKRSFDWNKFADPDCYPTLVDCLWNGSLVDRYTGLVVDGGRVLLPFPQGEYDSSEVSEPKLIADWVSADEVKLFRLVHHLRDSRADFDEYLRQAGFDVR